MIRDTATPPRRRLRAQAATLQRLWIWIGLNWLFVTPSQFVCFYGTFPPSGT